MASKGKKTKHVILDTGEMKLSETKYAMLVASGVTRPCHRHEIELKHLSAEEIAQGRWTDKQVLLSCIHGITVGCQITNRALHPQSPNI